MAGEWFVAWDCGNIILVRRIVRKDAREKRLPHPFFYHPLQVDTVL